MMTESKGGSSSAMIEQPSVPAAKHILVVDDEEAVAISIKLVLTRLGYTAEIAENAERGLRVFDASKHHLIITDFALGRMTGIDLARAVKAKHPDVPIILITAYAESIGRNRLADFAAVLGKPFTIEEIKAALAKAFQT